MMNAQRLLMDAVCVVVLAALMFWGAGAIAAVPLTLPPATAAADCNTPPAAPPKEVTVAGGLPGLNLADCGDKDKEKKAAH